MGDGVRAKGAAGTKRTRKSVLRRSRRRAMGRYFGGRGCRKEQKMPKLVSV